MIHSQQSFAQQQDKAAVREWRYKHSLTSLECYEYASKTKQLQDTAIVGHAVTNVSLTLMMLPLAYFWPFSVCRLFTTCWNYLYVSSNLYRPWMDVNTKCNLNKEQARRIEELWTLNTWFWFQNLQLLYPSFCHFSLNAYLAAFSRNSMSLNSWSCLVTIALYLFFFLV